MYGGGDEGTMDFLKLFLRGVGLLPSVIQSVEAMTGLESGEQKKHAVLGVVGVAIRIADALEQKTIVDPDGFSAGLGQVIDGVVACLNASLWHKG
jgi:hypothetical protein